MGPYCRARSSSVEWGCYQEAILEAATSEAMKNDTGGGGGTAFRVFGARTAVSSVLHECSVWLSESMNLRVLHNCLWLGLVLVGLCDWLF